jgi:hypothetical protein
LGRIADNTDPKSMASTLRRRRMRLFVSLLRGIEGPERVLSVLDLGGTAALWDHVRGSDDLGRGLELTILNLEVPATEPSLEGMRYLVGDARDLVDVADNEYDVVFSNSVLEHVGDRSDQQRMANEVIRVGRRYFVQTPSYWFPIEPHFLVPGFQYLPLEMRARLHRRFDLGWVEPAGDLASARADVSSIRLLRAAELRRLFPDARIVRERFLGWTKSLVAVGGRW